jgi:hypothetical protein
MNHVNQPMNQGGIRESAPRFNTLATCIRAGLYGVDAPDVQHMIERNIAIDSERAFEAQFSKKEKAA